MTIALATMEIVTWLRPMGGTVAPDRGRSILRPVQRNAS